MALMTIATDALKRLDNVKSKVTLIIALTASVCGPNAVAEQVRVPVGEQSDVGNIAKPKHGITKTAVESQFGSPESRKGPIGDPAIYFWEYKDFTVYFESNRVIHSVSKIKSNTAYKK